MSSQVYAPVEMMNPIPPDGTLPYPGAAPVVAQADGLQGGDPLQYQEAGTDIPKLRETPVALPDQAPQLGKDEMQAQPGIFTNERGNLKFVAYAVRCPCISLAIVYFVAILLTVILS